MDELRNLSSMINCTNLTEAAKARVQDIHSFSPLREMTDARGKMWNPYPKRWRRLIEKPWRKLILALIHPTETVSDDQVPEKGDHLNLTELQAKIYGRLLHLATEKELTPSDYKASVK